MQSLITTESLLGFNVYAGNLNSLVNEIYASIDTQKKMSRWLACFNPHSYAVAKKMTPFHLALQNADWLIPDGVGIVCGSIALNGQIKDRITGSDIFSSLNSRLAKSNRRIYLLGSTEATLKKLSIELTYLFPGINICGVHSPSYCDKFTKEENAEILNKINMANPDVLWVGLSSPKQDLWIHENIHNINAPFSAGVGAVFDFYSGQIKRPGKVVRALGLEWFFRLLKEPRRLWRRTCISLPLFALDLVLAKIKN